MCDTHIHMFCLKSYLGAVFAKIKIKENSRSISLEIKLSKEIKFVLVHFVSTVST